MSEGRVLDELAQASERDHFADVEIPGPVAVERLLDSRLATTRRGFR